VIHWRLKPAARGWRPWRRRRRVLAVFAYRYDAALVPALLANIEPLVDGWVALDDRQAGALLSDEAGRHRALLAKARDLGAAWILAVDPDERFERGTAEAMPRLTQPPGRPLAWAFRLRELYAADRYRVDGRWGEKRQVRLFTSYDPATAPDGAIHSAWIPHPGPHAIRPVELNLYHLKMILPARRQARRDLYKAADPAGRFQAIGYDYLADETGAAFETIPPGRGFQPPHQEDGGLWMASAAALGTSPAPAGAQQPGPSS
jgi:hypothetical protein